MYDPLIGTTIDGRYAVEALLGEGGMGFVYAARHVHIDKRVALKILRKEAAADAASAQRFIDEARAASKIGHQNIVDITDFGVLDDGHAYFVMEYLDGPTLAKLIATDKQIAPERAIAIATQIARGLHAAHMKGIIHRDLKPENIFVVQRDADRASGSVDLIKIVDFGIAKDLATNKKLTQVGMVLGTPEYISPEQATGSPSDHRVDIYALGCILYEMLTGDVPFRHDAAPETLVAHVIEAPQPPSERRPDLQIPPQLEAVVMKMLEKKPADRYADMRLFMNALDEVATQLPATSGRRTTREEAFAETAAAARLQDPRPPMQVTLPPVSDSSKPSRVQAPPTGWTGDFGTEIVPRAKAPKWIIVGVIGVVVAGVLFFVAGPSRSRAVSPPIAVAPATVAPTTAPAAKTIAPADKPIDPAKQVALRVVSDPPGAKLSIDGTWVGQTPYQGGIVVGAHRLSLHLDGFNERDISLNPTDDADLKVTLVKGGKKKTRSASAALPRLPATQNHAAIAMPHAPAVSTPAQKAPEKATDKSTELRDPF